jgi:hypothetical protein
LRSDDLQPCNAAIHLHCENDTRVAMPINYGAVTGGPTADTVTDPQKLFQALPAKAPKYAYLRDVQGDVLRKWYDARTQRDTVIKMNTGGGKTVVGLLALKSCINEKVRPAVYVAGDHYLCSQVRAEAADLGLAVVDEPRSLDFQSGRAILVIPVHTLVNGMSKFGVGRDIDVEIGSIVIDDAHACLATAEQQFTLSLPRSHPAFQKLLAIFSEDLRSQSITGTMEIERGDPRGLVQVPYWAWMDKQARVIAALADHQDERELKFIWPLLKEDLQLCRCFFNARTVEIAPPCLPVDVVPSFAHARRRIYMTATLSDDAILVTDFGADPQAVSRPVTPKTASDLGDRMILVPQRINTGIKDEDIKAFVDSIRSGLNAVVIVPSGERAKFWADIATPGLTLTAENLHQGVNHLRTTTGNVAVLVNKYDGVDLPGDACRILIVDGLPDARRFVDRHEQGVLRASDRFRARQVQRIEQGMGRAIRSNEDYCVVLLMGAQLLRTLYASGAAQHFSPATAAQMRLSEQISEQVARQGLAALAEPIRDVLTRHPGWVGASRNALIETSYPASVETDPIAIAQRAAFDVARRGRFEQAEQGLHATANAVSDDLVKGWLLAQAAAMLHPVDSVRSQQILLAANDRNSLVARPMQGIAYRRADTKGMDQARQAAGHLLRLYPQGGNDLIIGVNGLLDDLVFRSDGYETFEQALMDLGLHLGFVSQRPEKEGAGRLDVLWGIGQLEYLLLACKSEATAPAISKHYADEISGSVNWFRATYDHTCQAVPVIVHPSDVMDAAASPPPGIRVVATNQLSALQDACRRFASSVKDRLNEPAQVRHALTANGLLGRQFVDQYTISPKQLRAARTGTAA